MIGAAMADGDGPPSSAAGFAAAVLRVAVAQICGSAGFRAAKSSALDALAGVLASYLQSLGAAAAAAADSAGRTQSNLLDVAEAVAELRRRAGGYPGAWDGRAGWAPLREIKRFVEATAEVPFARPIRRGESPARGWRSSLRLAAAPPPAHVPAWLPAFPECADEEVDAAAAAAAAEGTAARPQQRAGGLLPSERERVRFRVGPTPGGRKGRRRRAPLPRSSRTNAVGSDWT